ncbi:MAG TPA: hypothetical protein VKR22_14625 [Acidimicrobiales bacterium]|nr:hypothetical protein [Acidimicrobiales bacterium]
MHEQPSTLGTAAPANEAPAVGRALATGTPVCVWNSFLETWTEGFAVAEVLGTGYRLRRLSDGHAFDDVFPATQVIRERRRIQQPGYGVDHIDRRQHIDDDEVPSAAGTPRLCE